MNSWPCLWQLTQEHPSWDTRTGTPALSGFSWTLGILGGTLDSRGHSGFSRSLEILETLGILGDTGYSWCHSGFSGTLGISWDGRQWFCAECCWLCYICWHFWFACTNIINKHETNARMHTYTIHTPFTHHPHTIQTHNLHMHNLDIILSSQTNCEEWLLHGRNVILLKRL